VNKIFTTNIYNDVYIGFFDLFAAFIFITFCVIIANTIRSNKSEPHYRFLTKALLAKLLSGTAFCILYLTYYAGDTLDYMHSINALNNVAFHNFGNYIDILFDGNKPEYYSYFNSETMYPATHMWKDPKTYIVVRLMSPFGFLAFGSFLMTTLYVSLISFICTWKLYLAFVKLYPEIDTKIAIATLFIPSSLFWGSGIMKDTIIFSALAIFASTYIRFVQNLKLNPKIILSVIISAWLMILVKPYVIVALIPGATLWFSHKRVLSIKSAFLRYLFYPFFIVFSIFIGAFIISKIGGELGEYGDIDSMIAKAQITQEDLKRENQYGENYYDIGEIENTPASLLKLAPVSIIAGLYRPFIWEARNPFILLSGLENLFTLILTLVILFKTKFIGTPRRIVEDPLVLFSIIFTIMFAFGIGMASANFGALVRYRIPLMPFFITALFIMQYNINKNKNALKRERIIIKR
jgi:hypothetical protein